MGLALPRSCWSLSAVVNWSFGAAARRHRRAPAPASALLAAAVAANLGVLGLLQVLRLLRHVSRRTCLERARHPALDLPLLHIILPVGISFFTFQSMSYVIDVYRGTLRPAGAARLRAVRGLLPAPRGRPDRARGRAPAAARATAPRPRAGRRHGAGVLPDLGGLVKKVRDRRLPGAQHRRPRLRDARAVLGAGGAGRHLRLRRPDLLRLPGYTDIAIGIALLLGFRFPENFNAPYRAAILQDFWRRWHITLSRWLRDYLYIPLGGNRGPARRTYRNLMLTMLLGGLWHGAAWTFVFWGFLHGGAMIVEHARVTAQGARLVVQRQRSEPREPSRVSAAGHAPGGPRRGRGDRRPPLSTHRLPWHGALARIGVFAFVIFACIFLLDSSAWRRASSRGCSRAGGRSARR